MRERERERERESACINLYPQILLVNKIHVCTWWERHILSYIHVRAKNHRLNGHYAQFSQ